jgi:Guanylate kinase
LDAIRAVVNAGKFCVLNLHPLSLKILKESDLMPFVVFVAPPSLEKLRAKKREKGEPFKARSPFVYRSTPKLFAKLIPSAVFGSDPPANP